MNYPNEEVGAHINWPDVAPLAKALVEQHFIGKLSSSLCELQNLHYFHYFRRNNNLNNDNDHTEATTATMTRTRLHSKPFFWLSIY